MRVEAVFTAVDRADRDDDELFGLRIKPLAGGFGDAHGQVDEIPVAPHRLKHFRDKTELLLDPFLNLNRLRVPGLVVKFDSGHLFPPVDPTSYSVANV